jgi:hypothetical protein
MPVLVVVGRTFPGMTVKRAKPDHDGIVTARLAGTAGRHASRHPLDVDAAAVAELREIADGRTDLLGEVAGRALGFGPGVGGAIGASMWPPKALEAALLIAAGADLIPLDPRIGRLTGSANAAWRTASGARAAG